MTFLRRLLCAYRGVAVFLLNTTVVFVLLNLLLYGALRWAGVVRPAPGRPPALAPEAQEALIRTGAAQGWFREKEPFFPKLNAEQVTALMLEAYTRSFVYEPFTELRERPFHGRFVNVDENGFRWSKGQGRWPPDRGDPSVFVFGGSTTFGYGVPDDETIPSHLRDFLVSILGRRVWVYNFGRGYYFSSQERALFEKLLLAGHVPEIAIFIDGLNDCYYANGEPEWAERLRHAMTDAAAPEEHGLGTILQGLPIARSAAWLRERLAGPSGRDGGPRGQPSGGEDMTPPMRRVVTRFLGNERMIEAIGAAYGVRTVFVWQPVPTYKYDRRYHAFARGGFGRHEAAQQCYAEMANERDQGRLGADFVWCADIQEHVQKPLYVDQVHYTPAMARRVAGCIVKGMVRRGLIAKP